jgi:vanadium chloroperoxidase
MTTSQDKLTSEPTDFEPLDQEPTLPAAANVGADPILFWNAVALEADRVLHTVLDPADFGSRGPCGATRSLAIVHLAMHDAYFGITRRYPPYLGPSLPKPPSGAAPDAAVAGAAHAALSALYPSQQAYFDAQHAAAGLLASDGDFEGHAFGRAVAARILALRANDPTLGDDGYAASVAPGHHRVDPDNPTQGFYAPFYGSGSRLFAATARHHLDAAPDPSTRAYDRALRQVRSQGIAPQLTGVLPAEFLPSRTTNETAIGLFWAYDGASGLGTPPRLYNQIIRRIAAARQQDTASNARMFALVNAAMGDAGILAWADKYSYDVWRPVVGIRENDASLGPSGVAGDALTADSDTGWLPLGAPSTNRPGVKNFTPPFPAYPSGHSTFGAAAFQSVRRFCGVDSPGPDRLAAGLTFVSDELNGVNVDNQGAVRPRLARRFTGGLWQMILENSMSRIFLGIHWSFDGFAVGEDGEIDLTQNIGGVRLGLDVADDIAAHGLRAANAAGPLPS